MTPGNDGKLPPLKGVPALNSKLKLNSIQLISPPSDSGHVVIGNPLTNFPKNPSYMSIGPPKHLTQVSPRSFENLPVSTVPSTTQISNPEIYGPIYETHSSYPICPVVPPPQQHPQSISKLHPLVSLQASANPSPPDHASSIWAASLQQAKVTTIEKQLRFQEKNRLAAMKSRQRKKKEWERLQQSEKALLDENRSLKERIAVLESEVRMLRENNMTSKKQ
mgnify:CR=1 FL=1